MGSLIALLALVPEAFGVQRWERTYDLGVTDRGYDVIQTRDDGYLVAGLADLNWLLLLKLDSLGDTLWSRWCRPNGYGEALAVAELPDGYVVAGSCWGDTVEAPQRMYLLRTDAAGDTLWTRMYGSGDAFAHQLLVLPDRGYLIAGEIYDYPPTYADIYAVRTDRSGDTIWSRRFGGSQDECFEGVRPTRDGGFVLFGWTTSFGSQRYAQGYIVRIDSLGDSLWSRTYGGTRADDGFTGGGWVLPDGRMVAAGATQSYSVGGGADMWLLGLDSLGDTLWSRVYGGPDNDAISAIESTDDGGYILTGNTHPGVTPGNGLLLKTDSLGQREWQVVYGPPGPVRSVLSSGRQVHDGGYIATGSTANFAIDVYVLKTDAAGSAAISFGPTARPDSGDDRLQILVPSPQGVPCHASCFLPEAGNVSWEVCDVSGRAVLRVRRQLTAGWHQVELPFDAPVGSYFIRASAGGKSVTRRLVVTSEADRR